MKNVIGPGGVRYPVTPDIERILRSMDRDALRSLVLEMAAYSPEAMRSLQLRATPEDEPTVSKLLAAADAALAGVDFDYHDPFHEDVDDGIQGVEEVVDELERHLDAGAHPVVRRVLQHLLTRLGDLARDADNADALLGVAERASTLYRTRGRRKRNWGITVLGAVANVVSKHAFGCLPVNPCLNDGSTVKPERVHVWGGEQSRPAALRASCRPPERKATMVTV